MEKWIVFKNKHTGKVLSQITVKGSFEGEIQSTKELLAYDHNLKVADITTDYQIEIGRTI